MNVAYEAFYLTQWLIYLVRLVLSFAYGVLAFIAKPGSRYIVPVIAGGVCYYYLALIEQLLTVFIVGFNTHTMPGLVVDFLTTTREEFVKLYFDRKIEPWMMHTGVAVLFAIAWIAYVLVSRVLAVVVGAFPKVTRPLRPLRRLRATNLKIKSAVVQLAVPKLRF